MKVFSYELSSIGKKLIMAGTGFFLLFFLVIHAFGNSAIYVSSKAFQHYADALHGFPVLVFLFGIALFIAFLLHVLIGINLFLKNREAGKSRYEVTARAAKRKISSTTMIYSGLLLLLFIIIHVSAFMFRDTSIPVSIMVRDLLGSWGYGTYYILSFCVLAVHLSHGFWSMLQTFGVNHPQYNTLIEKLTLLIPACFFLIFAGIPLYFMTGIGSNY